MREKKKPCAQELAAVSWRNAQTMVRKGFDETVQFSFDMSETKVQLRARVGGFETEKCADERRRRL